MQHTRTLTAHAPSMRARRMQPECHRRFQVIPEHENERQQGDPSGQIAHFKLENSRSPRETLGDFQESADPTTPRPDGAIQVESRNQETFDRSIPKNGNSVVPYSAWHVRHSLLPRLLITSWLLCFEYTL